VACILHAYRNCCTVGPRPNPRMAMPRMHNLVAWLIASCAISGASASVQLTMIIHRHGARQVCCRSHVALLRPKVSMLAALWAPESMLKDSLAQLQSRKTKYGSAGRCLSRMHPHWPRVVRLSPSRARNSCAQLARCMLLRDLSSIYIKYMLIHSQPHGAAAASDFANFSQQDLGQDAACIHARVTGTIAQAGSRTPAHAELSCALPGPQELRPELCGRAAWRCVRWIKGARDQLRLRPHTRQVTGGLLAQRFWASAGR
jgi:hypothetical protein